jgi:hypothetical protein
MSQINPLSAQEWTFNAGVLERLRRREAAAGSSSGTHCWAARRRMPVTCLMSCEFALFVILPQHTYDAKLSNDTLGDTPDTIPEQVFA